MCALFNKIRSYDSLMTEFHTGANTSECVLIATLFITKVSLVVKYLVVCIVRRPSEFINSWIIDELSKCDAK